MGTRSALVRSVLLSRFKALAIVVAVSALTVVSHASPRGAKRPSRLVPVAKRTADMHPLDILGLRKAGFTSGEQIVKVGKEKGRLLGEGHSAKAYRMTDVSGGTRIQYVLRLARNHEPGPLTLLEDPFPETNLGQAVASIGNSQILLRLPGRHAGMPHPQTVKVSPEGGPLASQFPKLEQRYREYLTKAAALPQESYDGFAEILHYLRKRGYTYDYYQARNILIDGATQSLYPVDLHMRESSVKLQMIANAMVDTQFAYRMYKQQQLPPADIQALISTVVDKSVGTMRLGLGTKLPHLDPGPVVYVQHGARLEYVYWLGGRDGQWPQVHHALSQAQD